MSASTNYARRPATGEDLEAIAEIWYRGWLDGHLGHVPDEVRQYRQPADFRERVPPRLAQTTVAVAEGAVAGFVMVHDDEVEQIYVAQTARGGPVATALLRHAEELIARRFGSAWLAVVAGNARARRFYERNGWSDAGGFDYPAEIRGGTFPIPCRRYEKRVSRKPAESR